MKKELHLFDFDGTITNKDSMFDFLWFLSKKLNNKSFLKIFTFSLYDFFLAFVGAKQNKEKAKAKFISRFVAGESVEFIQKIAEEYTQTRLPKILRQKAIEKLEKLKQNPSADLYLVSASPDIWLESVAQSLEMKLICTKHQTKEGFYTHQFEGKNCNGKEKAIRIQSEINLKEYQTIYAYGNSKGDFAMFGLADESFFRPFE